MIFLSLSLSQSYPVAAKNTQSLLARNRRAWLATAVAGPYTEDHPLQASMVLGI